MTKVEEVQKVLEDGRSAMERDQSFVELQDFYHEMLELGIASRQKYDLPPLDTVGRHLYEMQHRAEVK